MSRWSRTGRLRRPAGLVAQTQWLFCVCCVLALLVTVPAPLIGAGPWEALLAILTALAVGGFAVHIYLTGRASLAADLLYAVTLAGFTLACPAPAVAYGIVMPFLWIRACYGATWRLVVHGLLAAAAVLAAYLLWDQVPWHEATPSPDAVFTPMPMVFLVLGVARHLTLGLFARERAQKRDLALARLGRELLNVVDATEIVQRGHESVRAICAATPGLRAILAVPQEDHLTARWAVGDFPHPPGALAAAILRPSAAAGQVHPLGHPLPAELELGDSWVCLPTNELRGACMLLDLPTPGTREGLAPVQAAMNQVALALRNSVAHRDLSNQATTDQLTGLTNRAAFSAAIEADLHDTRTVLIFLDLDDFKLVNDGLGHAAGDELLRQVAGTMREVVRPSDLCARLGGDEFAVLLRKIDDPAALRVAERLVTQIAVPTTLQGQRVRVGASVGIARVTAEGSAEQLMQQADIAMYAAKAKGKNRVQIFEHGLLNAGERATLEAELRAAAGAGQLVVHYQPIMRLADRRCVGVEALVRWQHPTRGLLGPYDFIDTAERTGAIIDIGAFVLRQACADAAAWPAGPGGRLGVHVNVSAVQLDSPSFVEAVRACLADFAMEPKQLVLEITESMVLDSASVRAGIDELVALGVAVAIDDFGTGFSALTTLRTLPLDIVKIDKSFVADCPHVLADQAVVEAIVQMAHRLGMQIVAEGVERADQEEFLRAAGVDRTQGYHYLRPAPAADIGRWLLSQDAALLSGR